MVYLEAGVVVGGEGIGGRLSGQPAVVDRVGPGSAVVEQIIGPQPDAGRHRLDHISPTPVQLNRDEIADGSAVKYHVELCQRL